MKAITGVPLVLVAIACSALACAPGEKRDTATSESVSSEREQPPTFDVILEDAGEKKIEVIKVVRAATGLGLKEAKDLVDGAPKLVKSGLGQTVANHLGTELEAAGAKVKVSPASAPAGGGVRWTKGTFEQALEEARAKKKLVFVDFWASWCPPCKKMDRETFTNPDVIAAMNERFVCVSVDTESKTGVPLAQRFSITALPTLLVLAPDGSVRDRFEGFLPPEPFLARITKSGAAR